jgi:hypothetical protein
MAKKRRKEKGPWDRFVLWMRSNQRILWVVLLILCAFSFGFVGPVQDFFMGTMGSQAIERVYGETITQGDWKIAYERLSVLRPLIQEAWFSTFEPLPGALSEAALMFQQGGIDPLDYFAFQEKAHRLGLRVSDKELGYAIRALWQRLEGMRRAVVEFQEQFPTPAKDTQEQQMRRMRLRSLAQEMEQALRSAPFDNGSWTEIISRASRVKLPPREVEETLREVLLIAKLRQYIRDSVVVTPQEVFEEYQKERQRRKLSWIEAGISPELEEKVAGTVTEEKLNLYFDTHRGEFDLEPGIRAQWLLLPREHFEKEARAKITDADLERYYEQNRNEFRRPTVSSAEAGFYPLSEEDKAAFDKELFYSLEEVEDKVREKVIERRTNSEMGRFANILRQRLYPLAPRDDETASPPTPPTFSELVQEYDFLEMGSTDGYVNEEKAEAGFGKGYGTQVSQWFTSAARSQGTPSIKALERAVEGDNGMVFYADVDYMGARQAALSDVEDEVRKAVIVEEALVLLESALKEYSDKIHEGEKQFEDLSAEKLEVEVGEETVTVELGSVQSALGHVGKYESVMVPKPEEEETGEAGEEEDATTDEGEDGDEPAEVAHEASNALKEAGFDIEKAGLTGVAASPETEAVYLVRVDDVVLPDPEGFEDDKSWIRSRLLRERQQGYFTLWRSEIRREARGGLALSEEMLPGEAGEEPEV